MEAVETVAKEIYESYFFKGVGKNFFEKFLAKIISLDIKDFLAYNFRSFDLQYNNELILSLPILWQNFSISDWLELIEQNKQRFRSIKSTSEMGVYTDIQFLCKWLEVDGFQLFLNSSKIDKKNKLNGLIFGKNFTNIFVKDEDELLNLDADFEEGYYGCNSIILMTVKEKLRKDSNVNSFNFDEESIQQYLGSLISDLQRPQN